MKTMFALGFSVLVAGVGVTGEVAKAKGGSCESCCAKGMSRAALMSGVPVQVKGEADARPEAAGVAKKKIERVELDPLKVDLVEVARVLGR